jgi:RNA polymerase sigma factor (sigma-70 family)
MRPPTADGLTEGVPPEDLGVLTTDSDDGAAVLGDEVESLISREFEALFRAVYPGALRFAMASLTKEAAEDVVQTVFRRLWELSRKNPAIMKKPRDELTAIIFTGIRNERTTVRRGITRFARRVHRIKREAQRTVHGWMQPDSELGREELRAVLRREIGNLPPRCREVFELVRFGGWSYEATAMILGISPSTVHQHLSKANHILRDRLSEYRTPDGGWPMLDPRVHKTRAPKNEATDDQS